MDIAKIRKKLKEDQQTKADSKPGTVNQRSDNSTDEQKTAQTVQEQETILVSETAFQEDKEPVHKTENAQMPEITTKREPGDEIIEILTFSLMNEEFAFRITLLDEILRYQKIANVPKMPPHVLGITSLRGKIIPVISLKLKLALTDSHGHDEKGKILILKGSKGPIGAIVDKVIGVVRIAKSELLPPPSHLSEAETKYIEGVAVIDTRFISILNIEEVITMK